MTLVNFKSKNHPQQTRYKGSNRNVDDRALPQDDFEKLNERFRFSIDVASSDDNCKLDDHFTHEDNGLAQSWSGQRVYCNPPFSEIFPWVLKAWKEDQAEIIVMLLPANRTEQTWWQKEIEPYRDKPGSVLTVEFLQGRLRFLKPGEKTVKPNSRPPFGCCLCIWNWSANRPQQKPGLFEVSS